MPIIKLVFKFLFIIEVLEFLICSAWWWWFSQLSHIWLLHPMDCSCQVPLSMAFPRQEYWSRLPLPSLGIFLAEGSNPHLLHCRQSPALQAGWATREAHVSHRKPWLDIWCTNIFSHSFNSVDYFLCCAGDFWFDVVLPVHVCFYCQCLCCHSWNITAKISVMKFSSHVFFCESYSFKSWV